ncbi:MAG: uroporphyrinogen-III decarboxylase, partial [bacterium]|nr:uroporphyrinogen-III decarboxylase [bacterium]
STDYAIVLNLGVGPVHQCQFLRGYAEWLQDLILDPAFAQGMLERVADFWIAVSKRALEEAGEYVDLVWFGDDIGMQKATLIRPELYRELIKPVHKRMVSAVKPFGKPVIYHTCGAVYPVIPDLIDVGIDVLNPIQVSAKGMDTARIKREFGRDLVFWGAIDSQGVLPQGTPGDVIEEVKRRIAHLAPGGGYVLAAAHNIQQDVPPENVVAMY